MRFGTSRLYAPYLKLYLIGGLLLLISALFFFNVLFPPAEDAFITNALALLSVLSGVAFVVDAEIRLERSGTYYITNFRVIAKEGILGTKIDSVSYSMIVNVKMTQTFKERIFGLGNVEILTARGRQEIDMLGVKRPKMVENAVYNFLEKHNKPQPQSKYR
jgi:uncharacterized membrane protein YdbT with pleckstrin-like domain